jgi:phosphate:Na+ symporter
MEYLGIVFSIVGSLGLFLYGMKVMSDGIQQNAGDRLQKFLNLMTGNRFSAVLTGLLVTAIIQSSSATTVMVVSFVNAGLLTLTQSIGVIMGANIGTTITAWIVSLVGFSMKISALAIPAIGLGFLLKTIRWKHKDFGDVVLGFGLLFLGLDFLTKSMPTLTPEMLGFITSFSNYGVGSMLIGTVVGIVITLIIHSSSASTAIVLTMAFNGLLPYEMAAAMILGANIGTTVDAALASIGTKTAAKRAALTHILFNVIGTILALFFFKPLLWVVDLVTPGTLEGAGITTHLAMLHTVFNILNTLVFFPFVNQFAKLVSFLIKDDHSETVHRTYKLDYKQGSIQGTPEFNIVRAEKEIRDLAGIANYMYSRFSETFGNCKEDKVTELIAEMQYKENYADQMREQLTIFLIECSSQQLNRKSEDNIPHLLRIVADLEDMTDDCYSMCLLLDRSVKKELTFKQQELKALDPYIHLVKEFLTFVQEKLGRHLSAEQIDYADDLENKIDKLRDKLRKMGRKQIEAGEDVKMELLFIDLVRRIEKVGDYCYDITEALQQIR